MADTSPVPQLDWETNIRHGIAGAKAALGGSGLPAAIS
jgi:hypothetical protein